MKISICSAAVALLLAGCGSGDGLRVMDTAPQHPRILQDPPPRDWLPDVQRQYQNLQLRPQGFTICRNRFHNYGCL